MKHQHVKAYTAIIFLGGCHAASESVFPGYAEGEYVRIASPYAGNLTTLNVKRGDEIAAGAPLFALEQANERAAREEAAARVKQAEARLENLRKGKRSEEIAAVRAQLAQADASLKLSSAGIKAY
jgi:HlyD family secretion protein